LPTTPSPKHGLTRPADGDFINSWPASTRQVIDYLDPYIAGAITTTPRPAAGLFGRFHLAADGTLTFDTGSAWVEIRSGVVGVAQLAADVPLPPVGTILPYAGTALPGNGKWAWAAGGLVDRSLYSEFYAAQGGAAHTYNGGVDPGGNLVRLPDKRGRVSVGADTMGGGASAGRLTTNATTSKSHPNAVGQNGGSERHSLIGDESGMPLHAHTASQAAHTHTISGGFNVNPNASAGDSSPAMGNAQNGAYFYGGVSGGTNSLTPAVTVANAAKVAAATDHNNVQPYEVDNYIVRVA